MDILECLRATNECSELNDHAANEIERLRAENEIFRTALQCADVAMAGAPIWHSQHRVLSDVLIKLKQALAKAPPAAAIEPCAA